MTKLESGPGFGRQQHQEFTEPRRVFFQIRRQLEQERPKLSLEHGGYFKEISDRIGGVFEALEMRDSLWGFEDEFKCCWHFRDPSFQDRGFGHSVESVVNLDGAKSFAVIAQHLLLGQILGIERSLP